MHVDSFRAVSMAPVFAHRDSVANLVWFQREVDIQARKLLLEVFLRFWGRGERYRRMETGVLLRISLRTS